jgi:hypothetical protein
MADDDLATQAELDVLAALESELSAPVGDGRIGPRGPVVAGPPDDALARARREITAALSGNPTPGAMFF